MATKDELILGIREMGKALSGSEGALGHLTCTEFEPIARLLVLAGMNDLAVDALVGHSFGDDDSEHYRHHAINEAEADPDRSENDAAWAYVRELQGELGVS